MDSKKFLKAFSRSERHRLLKAFPDEEFMTEIKRRQKEAANNLGKTSIEMSQNEEAIPPVASNEANELGQGNNDEPILHQ